VNLASLTLLAESGPSEGWRYAGWIAVDLRLLLFVTAVSALVAVGVAALVVRSGRARELVATFIIAFTATLILTILLFNGIASHPVFVIESLFPFP